MALIGVAWAGNDSSYADFVTRHSISFPSIDDTSGTVYARYEVPNQPAWVFLRNGSSRTVRGTLEPDEVRAEVEKISDN